MLVELLLEAKTEKTTFPSWLWCGLQLVKRRFKWWLGVKVPSPLREVGFFVISLWVFRGQIWYKNMIRFSSPILTPWPQLQKSGFCSCKQESRLCPAAMICLSSRSTILPPEMISGLGMEIRLCCWERRVAEAPGRREPPSFQLPASSSGVICVENET